ncbi:hypothetical protein AB0C10_37550 [Microbispora amethystogenes]|uniref:hypothetical protein n=1 Tax=Microbispora amethystogenes TaxID=1427754 RepID=UPI0033D33A2E
MTTAPDDPGRDCCDKNKCHGRKRDEGGGYCHRPAGWGTDHPGTGRCKLHGGATPNHGTAARQEQARRAVVTYGLPREIDPAAALLEEVHRTAGHVAWLNARVSEMEEADLVWGVTEEVDKSSGEFPGTDTTKAAKPNVWLELYRQERKHLVDVSAAAVRAGVDAALVRLTEQQGAILAGVVSRTADGLLAAVLGLLAGDAADRVRDAWPSLVAEIAPRELRAAAGGGNG